MNKMPDIMFILYECFLTADIQKTPAKIKYENYENGTVIKIENYFSQSSYISREDYKTKFVLDGKEGFIECFVGDKLIERPEYHWMTKNLRTLLIKGGTNGRY